METTIFYFSATGNSLSLTRNLAVKLGNCELVSIAKAIKNETIEVQSAKVGFVFPVFAWGMPRIVEEFIQKIKIPGDSYVFAIATCVAIPGNTMKDLQKLLQTKGIRLQAGFAVKSGRSSLMQLNSLDNIIIKLDRQRLRIKTAEARMPEIITKLKKLAKHKPETSSLTANIFGSMFHGLAVKTFKSIATNFVVEDSCTGCGNCAKLCPRSNIAIENGRPVFLHNCELCHACIQWCPNFAIKHPNFDSTLKQYRNPVVRMNELIAN